MKKRIQKLVFNTLCNSVTGALIRFVFRGNVPCIRWSKYRFDLRNDQVGNKMVASVFFGFYESAEVRLIEKYLPQKMDVVELGSSAGIVSSHISSRLGTHRNLVCVEGNPYLLPLIQANITKNGNKDIRVEILNIAISKGKDFVEFGLSEDHTASGLGVKTERKVKVTTFTLTDLLSKFDYGEYFLVCDIEGAEAEIIFNDSAALENCVGMIIELHQTYLQDHLITIEDLKKQLSTQLNFELIEQDGNAYFFKKPGKV